MTRPDARSAEDALDSGESGTEVPRRLKACPTKHGVFLWFDGPQGHERRLWPREWEAEMSRMQNSCGTMRKLERTG